MLLVIIYSTGVRICPCLTGAMEFVAVSMTALYVSLVCVLPVYAELTPLFTGSYIVRIYIQYLIFNFCMVLSAGFLSFFIPCYQLGKNAEAVGQNCIICGILSIFGIIGLGIHIYLRGKIRKEKGISVSSGQSHNKSILHRKCCCVCL